MKRKCKNIDISSRDHIRTAILSCLKGKWGRHDTVRLFFEIDPLKRAKTEIRDMLVGPDKSGSECIVERLTDIMRSEIIEQNLCFRTARYRRRYDTCCAKWREIGIHDIKQQMYDYVAVMGMEELLRRIGEYQCASIPGRGQSYGIRAIRNWLRDKSIKYAWKGDIKQCFPSIKREMLMAFLERRIANKPLLWLVGELLKSMPNGLSIGSYLSQWLCNLYLSQLYHFVSEECYYIRRGKRISMVRHVLFYMDDILLLGNNSKNLLMAGRRISQKLNELGLSLKGDWRSWKLDNKNFIDIMGVKIYRNYLTVRSRVFLRLRRSFAVARAILNRSFSLPVWLCRKIIAYYGVLKYTDSFKITMRYKVRRSIIVAKEIISHDARRLCCPAWCD